MIKIMSAVVIKLSSAFLSPLMLMIILLPIGIIESLFTGGSINLQMPLWIIFAVYIYALPVYLLLAIPVSIVIDKFNPKWKVLYYSLAG